MKQSFAGRFRKLREREGWSQERAAEIFGAQSKTTVQNWEKAQDFPECTRLLNIADVFKVSLDWLFDRDIESFRPVSDLSGGGKESTGRERNPTERKKAG